MSTAPDIWMPLYIGDYLADTMHLEGPEHGAYLLLLFAYWRNWGPLPDDDKKLAAIARTPLKVWMGMRGTIAEFFEVVDGRWLHKRVEQELSNACEKKRLATEKASKAAAARWPKRRQAVLKQSSSSPQAVLDECPSPSPSPAPSEQEPRARARSKDPAGIGKRCLVALPPAHANGEDF